MKLSKQDYEELLGILCPWCKHKVPDTKSGARGGEWFHCIPDTDLLDKECWATRIRGKIDVGPKI